MEDDTSVREMYATRLRERYEIDTACNAEEGLTTIRTIGPYAVVISDQHMPPGMGGLDFLAEVRKLSPDSVCLLLTGHANLEEAIAALNSGVVFRFLTKPCLGELLIRSIGASLAQYRMANLERRRVGELLASITSILVGISADDKVMQWNKPAELTFRLTAHDVLDKPVGSLPIPWDSPPILRAIADCRRGGPVRLNDVQYTRADGSNGLLGLSLTQFAGAEETTPGVLIVGAEITERRNMESQLRHAQKLEAIGRLSAGIAHEINTPTQYVGDNVRFLKDAFTDVVGLLDKLGEGTSGRRLADATAAVDLGFLTEEIPRAIQAALEGVERTASIVRALREFSHPAESKMAVDLNRAIESTITVARNEWKYVAELVSDLDPDLPAVPCLPGEFNQVILNLIVNAAHAIDERLGKGSDTKGTITISTRQEGAWAEIRVADTGAGIPENIRHRIFDPFFTTKEVGKGTGQGLSIAHAVVVQKHGGTIAVASEVGTGTTFVIRLPLEEAAALVARGAA